jgi:hypothetical protein
MCEQHGQISRSLRLLLARIHGGERCISSLGLRIIAIAADLLREDHRQRLSAHCGSSSRSNGIMKLKVKYDKMIRG